MKTYSYCIIILILIFGKTNAQSISLKINLEKTNFEYLELVLPKVLISNNGDDSISFKRYFGHGPEIHFKIRDARDDICASTLPESNEGVHYYRLAPKSSVYFPLSHYYIIPHGKRSDKTKYLLDGVLKPGEYSVEASGLNSFSDKYYFTVGAVKDTSDIEILNKAHQLCSEGRRTKDNQHKFEGIRLLENLIRNTNNSMILLRSIRALGYYYFHNIDDVTKIHDSKTILFQKLQSDLKNSRYTFWVFNHILNHLRRQKVDNKEFIQFALEKLPNDEFKRFLKMKGGKITYPDGLTLHRDYGIGF